jgi:hypothetical protein
MRCAKVLLATVLGVSPFLPAGSASAAFHLQSISELMLSRGGTSAAQFVELRDPGNESFPGGDYRLTAYDSGGGSGTGVLLNGGNGGTALNDWTVVSPAAAAQGLTGNQTDDLGLDPVNGQVCFQQSGTAIACVNWGTIASQVPGSSKTNHVPTPGDGQAVALCSGSYVITTPTPGAANACPAPGGGGGAGGEPPQAAVKPEVRLGGSLRQRLGKSIALRVACSEPCLAIASGSLSVPNTSRTFRIRSRSTQIAKGATATLRLSLSRKARRAAKRALRARRGVRARLSVRATNSAGTDRARRTIKLKL